MRSTQPNGRTGQSNRRTRSAFYLAAGLALAACGGGGGGEAPVEAALVQSVSSSQVLEGAPAAASPQLEFIVVLDRPAVVGVDVTFSTASTAKAGAASLGSATGGASCAEGVDYVSVAGSRIRIAQGSTSASLRVAVCPDARFEPHETLRVDWTSARAPAGGGFVLGTILNDDAGGLNGTGALSSLGGMPAFGRDVNPLTNTNADGPLGFAYALTPGTTGPSCTLDTVTGLTWQGSSSFRGSYAEALAYANSFDNCGFTDWRLPTVNELLSLVDAGRSPAINADAAFSGVRMSANFWTGELKTPGSVDAWTVDIGNGGGASFVARSDVHAVRLVRGGTQYPACDNANNRFSVLGDGTVADSKTGLMWKQCHEGLSGASCGAGTSLGFADVPSVLAQLSAVNAPTSSTGLGYSDWRIPSRNELDSLANRSCPPSVVINTAVFPATDAASYISGTPDAGNPEFFWFVNFGEGSVSSATVANKRLRLVRAGQ